MAPAFGMAGYPQLMPEVSAKKVGVVHGWGDDVVSPSASFEFAERIRLICTWLLMTID